MVKALETKTIKEVTETLIDYRGKTPPKSNSGVRLVTAKVVKNGFILDENFEYVSEETYKRWMTRGIPGQWDILITTEAPLGELAQIRTRERIALAQRIILLRGNPKIIDQSYYFFALRSPFVQNQLKSRASGTTVSGIKQSELLEVEVPYYPLNYQKKVAEILSCIDDLIEVNLNRIRIFEEFAQSIYEEWFIKCRHAEQEQMETIHTSGEKLPKGWSNTSLSSLIDNVKKKEKAGVHLHDLPYIPIGCIKRKSMFLKNVESGKIAKSSLIRFRKHDILFGAMRPYFHKVAIAPSDGVTRTTCFVLRPKTALYYSYSVMTVFQESTIHYANSRSTGSTIPYAVWENGLADMPIVLPNERILEEFNSIMMPIFEEIITTHFRINLLEKTRESLLPKLISGEVDVDKLDFGALSD